MFPLNIANYGAPFFKANQGDESFVNVRFAG